MVLLQAAELLPQRLQLCLQVRPAESELIQDLAQAVNVSLHALAKGQLRLVPGSEKGNKTEQSEPDLTIRSFFFFLMCPSIFLAVVS